MPETKIFENHEIKEIDFNVLTNLTAWKELKWKEGKDYFTFYAHPGPFAKEKESILSNFREIALVCEPNINDWRELKITDEKGWTYSIQNFPNNKWVPSIDLLHKKVISQMIP